MDKSSPARRILNVPFCAGAVYLAFIAVYAWSLLPAPKHQDSQSLACLSHMKQLAMGALMYSNEYDDRMPAADAWADNIKPILRYTTPFQCPAASPAGTHMYGIAFATALGGARTTDRPDIDNELLFYDSKDVIWGAHGEGRAEDRARHDNSAFLSGRAKSRGRLPSRAQ